MNFSLIGTFPECACTNCSDKESLKLIPYHKEASGPMLAILILCGLCRNALSNNELGAHIDIRVAGQKGWN